MACERKTLRFSGDRLTQSNSWQRDTELMLGSAAKHSHDLVVGTTPCTPVKPPRREVEARIREIGALS